MILSILACYKHHSASVTQLITEDDEAVCQGFLSLVFLEPITEFSQVSPIINDVMNLIYCLACGAVLQLHPITLDLTNVVDCKELRTCQLPLQRSSYSGLPFQKW